MHILFELQAELCRAMGHSIRQEILYILRDQPKRVHDISQLIGLPQNTVSRHLAVLRNNGIVVTQHKDQDIFYRIDNPKIVAVNNLLCEVLTDQAEHRRKIAQAISEHSEST